MKKKTKLYTCKVCGEQFELLKENKYIGVESNGVSAAFNGTKYFDCFDCPKCGCQNFVNVRLAKKEK